jgi:hypothetical protein
VILAIAIAYLATVATVLELMHRAPMLENHP